MTLVIFERFRILHRPAFLILVSGECFPIRADRAADAHQLGLSRGCLLGRLRIARVLSPGIQASKSHNSERHNENSSHRLLLYCLDVLKLIDQYAELATDWAPSRSRYRNLASCSRLP